MTDNPNTTQIIPTDDRVVMALTKRDYQALNSILFELENTPTELPEVFASAWLAISDQDATSLRNLWSRPHGIPIRH